MDSAEIAVKTSETNELNNPENMDLLSPICAVRVIITKQAPTGGLGSPVRVCALCPRS